jgi:cytochrome P450
MARDPPRHKQLRSRVDEWFSAAVRLLDNPEIATSRGRVRSLEQGTCDFVSEIAARIPLYVICKMMGVAQDGWEQIFL